MTCPNCGYCPHCGRQNLMPYNPWPQPPYYPQPIWISTVPPVTGGLTGGSIGTGGLSGTSGFTFGTFQGAS